MCGTRSRNLTQDRNRYLRDNRHIYEKGCRELTNQFYASFMSTFWRRVEREDDCANSQESWFRTGASKNLPNKLTKGSYSYIKTKRKTLKPANIDYTRDLYSSWALLMSKGNPKMAEIKNQIKPSYRRINANLLIFYCFGAECWFICKY